MNPDVLFENFPDIVLSSFRKQMLLGIVPADMVQRILEPLLSNFPALMLELPTDLQTDFENILRLYPDVAQRFGVRITPPVVQTLRSLARKRRKSGRQDHPEDDAFDMAAEPQKGLEVVNNSFVDSLAQDGQGFFTTNRGNHVYIEFSCSEDENWAIFEYKPPRMPIEINICGICAATLTPENPRRKIPLDALFQILMQCAPAIEIKIIEKN